MNNIKTRVKGNKYIKAKDTCKPTIAEKYDERSFYSDNVKLKTINHLICMINAPNTNTIKMKDDINWCSEFVSFKKATLYLNLIHEINRNKIFDKRGFDNLISDNKIKNKISNKSIPIKEMQRKWL